MEAVDQPLDHRFGDVVRILVAHLQAGQHLLALAIQFVGENAGFRVMSDSRFNARLKLSFITTC